MNHIVLQIRRISILTLCLPAALAAQQLEIDEHTLLLVHFDNDLTGARGEIPISAEGVSFEEGVLGSGAYFGPGSQLNFSSDSTVNSLEGTVEFWIKPRWDGDDGKNHFVVYLQGAGGLAIMKDGGGFWRGIFRPNQYQGLPEVGTGIFVTQEWKADEWHHTAFTWSAESVRLYMDGLLRAETAVTGPLPEVSATTLQIGGRFTADEVDAVLDELRISDTARSAGDISLNYWRQAGGQLDSLQIKVPVESIWKTWSVPLQLFSVSDGEEIDLDGSIASWTSSNPAIADVDSNGVITGHDGGSVQVTAKIGEVETSLEINIQAPLIEPMILEPTGFLATPADDYIWEMPVVVVQFIPTLDGRTVDTRSYVEWQGNVTFTIDEFEQRLNIFNHRVKFMLEEGSRFRGYKDSAARPSLGYRVVKIFTFYEPTLDSKICGYDPAQDLTLCDPDYFHIFDRIDARHYVENEGVKEIWVWTDHSQPESNMSSPFTGDISNSYRREDDLPVYDRTYVVYGYNQARTQAEAIHNHGHQLEAILSHIDRLRDGNSALFWGKFVGTTDDPDVDCTQYANSCPGEPDRNVFITGRAGWTHMPPNTREHYDYLDPILVESDIEDWRPDRSGDKKLVNRDTWGSIAYQWPLPEFDVWQRTESQWYIYWMQAMPGADNTIPYGDNYMTNWWEFTADWDGAIAKGLGLYASEPTATGLDAVSDLPIKPDLHSNFPNPFSTETAIGFELTESAEVRLEILSVIGQRVKLLVDERLAAGRHISTWRPSALPSGLYFVRLVVGATALTRPVLYVR